MAWSWSHSQEAYCNAEANLHALPYEELCIIFAEWRAAKLKGGAVDSNVFNQRKYERALKHAQSLTNEDLAEWIWERASEHATCDNGGFNAYMCPDGCHTVPFDLEEGVQQPVLHDQWR